LNIYLFELKAQIKSFIAWTFALLFLLFVFMKSIYPIFYDSLDDVLAMLNAFPPEFAAAFGLHIADLFSYGGFFSFTFSYLAILGAIMAASLSVSVFAREKRSNCASFLFTKPRNRGNIYIAKLLSNLTVLVAANLLFIAAAVAVYMISNQDGSLVGKIIFASCGLFFTQLVFLAIGILWATFAKKVRSVSGIATVFGFAGFILSALVEITEEEGLRFVAPLKYFDPIAVFSDGGYETNYVVTAVVVIIICMVLSYYIFCKTDAPAA